MIVPCGRIFVLLNGKSCKGGCGSSQVVLILLHPPYSDSFGTAALVDITSTLEQSSHQTRSKKEPALTGLHSSMLEQIAERITGGPGEAGLFV
jgi:hypothetical protein